MASTHDTVKRHLEDTARKQGWGNRTRYHKEADGKELHRYDSATHVTEVVHHGSQFTIFRHRMAPPPDMHARHTAEIAKASKAWGKQTFHARLPSGMSIYQFEDATHTTSVIHQGGKMLTHRKPRA
jgi:hypothetical protein